MPVIKTRGSKPAKKTAKPAAKKGTAKKSTTKTAAKAKAGKKGATKAKTSAKKAKASDNKRDYRSPKTDMSKTQLNKFLKPLAKHAEKRNKHYEDWKEEVAATNTALIEALNAGVPVNLIVEAADVARQHVYKLLREIEEGKRTKQGVAKNPSGRQPNSTTKKASKGTTKARTSSKKGTEPKLKAQGRKAAAKKAGTKKVKSGKKTIKRK